MQAAWHPHSEAHVLLLTSDSRLRLYNTTTDLSVPEQVFHARTATHQQGATFSLAAASSAAQLSGFAFGAPLSWGMFSVLLLAEDGGVHVLCPVAPFGEQAVGQGSV